MALIAPGAFLWLTYAQQASMGRRWPASDLVRILAALLLCFATAISYAELSKLYPGAGSSYFLPSSVPGQDARLQVRPTGQVHHRLGQSLYYWIYPG